MKDISDARKCRQLEMETALGIRNAVQQLERTVNPQGDVIAIGDRGMRFVQRFATTIHCPVLDEKYDRKGCIWNTAELLFGMFVQLRHNVVHR